MPALDSDTGHAADLRRVEELMQEDAVLQQQLLDLESSPPPPPEDEEARRLREARKAEISGLVSGGLALLASFFTLPFVAAFPAGILLVDVMMAWGTLSWVRLLVRKRQLAIDDRVIAALLPAVAIASLARFLAAEQGILLPLGLRFTVAFPVLIVVALTCLVAFARPARRSTSAHIAGWLALAVAMVLLLAIATGSPNQPIGAWPTLGLTLGIVVVAVASQALVARKGRAPWWRALGSAPALGLAAAQLLDGTVSYLAVANPLGLLAHASQEQIWLSAFLIQWTGPGYILAKWALALVLVRVLDGPGARNRLTDPIHRLGLYLLMAYISMGPAIYSTVRLFV